MGKQRHLRAVVATETKRAKGKRLLSDLSEVHRRRARVLKERSDLDLKLALLEHKAAEILDEIAGNDVQLETGEKRRKDARQPLPPVEHDDMAQEAADEVERILG